MRNKKRTLHVSGCIAVFLLAASFAGCGSGNTDLVKESLVDITDSQVGSSTAQYGNLEVERNFGGTLYYPVRTELKSPVNGCALKEIVVKEGDYVKKGDLIASLETVPADQQGEKQEQIEKKKAEMENVRNYAQQEIASLQQTMNTTSDANERQICELKIREQQLTLTHMEEEYEKDIGLLEEEMQQIQSVDAVDGIYAPYDGVIDAIFPVTAGTVMTVGRSVAIMYSAEKVLIQAQNPGDIRYGQKVQVLAGVGENRKEYAGTVVAADNTLQDSIKNGKLYIRLEGEFNPKELTNIEVKATGYQVENVLTVKAAAVFEQKNQQYVYLLEDGKLMQRHVIVGGSDGTNAWIIQGLSEGDVVSIQ